MSFMLLVLTLSAGVLPDEMGRPAPFENLVREGIHPHPGPRQKHKKDDAIHAEKKLRKEEATTAAVSHVPEEARLSSSLSGPSPACLPLPSQVHPPSHTTFRLSSPWLGPSGPGQGPDPSGSSPYSVDHPSKRPRVYPVRSVPASDQEVGDCTPTSPDARRLPSVPTAIRRPREADPTCTDRAPAVPQYPGSSPTAAHELAGSPQRLPNDGARKRSLVSDPISVSGHVKGRAADTGDPFPP